MYKAWGQYDKVVSYYEKSLAIKRELKDRPGEGISLHCIGTVYSEWGQYDGAEQYYQKALAVYREVKNRLDEGRVLMAQGLVHLHREQPDKALAGFKRGLAIRQQIKVSTRWPKNLIANLYLDQDDFRRAQPLVEEAGYRSTRGRSYLLQAKYQRAKAEYEKLLESAERNRNADNLSTAYSGLGLNYEGMKDNKTAAEYCKKAVAFSEELRTSLTANQREKFFDARVAGFLRIVPYEGLARVLMRMQKPKEAMKGSEYTKARVFAEKISRKAQGQQFAIPGDVLKKDRAITDQLASLKKQRQKAYEKNNKLAIEALEPQVKELEQKFQAHIKTLREQYPLFAATRYPEPMGLSQTALTGSEWTLSYDVTDTGILIYLTSGKELVKGLFKPITRTELDGLVRKFREPLEVTRRNFHEKLESFDLAAGNKLSDVLLSDMLPDLPEGTPIMVVPDDSLGVLPFEMLVLNESGTVNTDKKIPCVTGAEFFGDRNPISYYQSITALTPARTYGKRKGSAKRLLAMADPVFGIRDKRVRKSKRQEVKLSGVQAELYKDLMAAMEEGKRGLRFGPLPLTGNLADNLARIYGTTCDVYSGFRATKESFLKRIAPTAKDYDKIVFATHGYFGKDLPGIMEPVLVLSLVPPGTDGYLRMSEVMGLKLSADMVALTACQTGLGRRLSGEGVMGMGRAFQYAGARAILMSLWSVEQKSAVDLVETFFRHLKEGKGKLDALRLARKEIPEAGYDHPFFWAGFILAGEVD